MSLHDTVHAVRVKGAVNTGMVMCVFQTEMICFEHFTTVVLNEGAVLLQAALMICLKPAAAPRQSVDAFRVTRV